MAKRGRKPTPTTLKILRGNPGHEARHQLGAGEPKPASGLPECPEWLRESARQAYEEFAPALASCKVGTQLDGAALAMLAESYANYREAAALVAKGGAVWIEKADHPGGIPKFAYSPYWAVMNREWKKTLALLTEFGMTPSARSRVKTDTSTASKLDKYRNA